MKRVLRRLAIGIAWILGGVTALIVVIYLVVLAINWRDEPPSEAALQLAKVHRDRPAVADADNGYLYVMAFPGPTDAAGAHFREARTPAIQKIISECRSNAISCGAELRHSDDLMRDWITSEQWLLDRYRTLIRHAGWREADLADATAPLPAYGTVMEGQLLLLAQAHLLAAEGDASGVRAMLEEDVRFWRRTLAASDILISRMIAVAALHHTFEIGNLVLRRLPPGKQLDAMPAEWRVPLTDDERSLLRTFSGEWVFGDNVMREAKSSGTLRRTLGQDYEPAVSFRDRLSDSLFGSLYQSQASSNLRAEMFLRATEALHVPFDRLPEGIERADGAFGDPLADKGFAHWVYNPMGKVLSVAASAGFSRYAARVADVEGTRRIAVLATELRSRKVSVDDMPAEMTRATLRSPFNGKPFLWSPTQQAIVFVGLQTGERGRHAVEY